MVQALLVGVGVGILSSLLGIGGGPILIPILLSVFHLDMPKAAGTSLAVVIPTGLAALAGHLLKKQVDLSLAGLIAIGGFCGAVAGTILSEYLPAALLKRLFALLLIYLGGRMLTYH